MAVHLSKMAATMIGTTLTLDGVTSFLRAINVSNTCQRLRYSQPYGGISSVQ